jgi:hypothetical protein
MAELQAKEPSKQEENTFETAIYSTRRKTMAWTGNV